MTVLEALTMIRFWRNRPMAVDILLQDYERLKRELQTLKR